MEGKKSFNFFAFLFCGTYYFYRGSYIIGLLLYVISIAIPMKYYFLLGLCCGFFSGSVKCKISVGSIILSIVSVIVFVALKLVRLYYIGGM